MFQYSVRRLEHIVTKEARPICTLVRRLAAEVHSGGRRALNFAESSSNIGAWSKGRSSSARLARHLRQVAPDMLLTDLQLGVPYVRSAANPADAPPRGRRIRREPLRSERSALINALLSGEVNEQTDAAFEASTRSRTPLSDLLEPVAGPPYKE